MPALIPCFISIKRDEIFMRYREVTDPFLNKQPEPVFMAELSEELHKNIPCGWNKRSPAEGEVLIKEASMEFDFPDEELLLETVYEDFRAFLKVCHVGKGAFVFKTSKNACMEKESYSITVNENSCCIEAGDTDGIRRAFYFIEDEMHRREGCFLPIGTISRAAVIKTRISRSVLATNYNTGHLGELGDDVDYYPDNYLNRLAHDGVNAIWVQEHFRAILPSEIIKEYGRNGEKRLEKLNDLIRRAKRYGIKVFLECIEPASSYNNPDLKNYDELLGQSFCKTEFAFCSSQELGKAYIRESTAMLFKLVPDLGGLVNISLGETVGCCAAVEAEPYTCPNCLELGFSKAEVLVNCERELLLGMRAVKPDAELISWAYALRGWTEEDRQEYLQKRDSRVISMINFEDLGEAVQLGKVKKVRDYWLSYAGPGKLFEAAADAAKEKNAPLFAKIQVCNSHEVASVPYVPVPGILYDKYKYMHENGVNGVMYCWYFGNYPSMMSKAAGELAFAPFFENKSDFLVHLAGIYWGKDAKRVAKAYQLFEDGYSNYPLNTCFEWHGPMTDGSVWPLHLNPVDLPVSRAYQLDDMVGCDRLGETMLMAHSYDDILTLCNEMSDKWHKGVLELEAVPIENNPIKAEQKRVSQALDILFSSGRSILYFYYLRNRLGLLLDEPKKVLLSMREIVLREIKNSNELKNLCMEDNRLGYHSEAVGYKFFPEKLDWRIEKLKNLLETEFIEAAQRIEANQKPLPFYFGEAEGSHCYAASSGSGVNDGWEYFMFADGSRNNNIKIRIYHNERDLHIEIFAPSDEVIELKPEFTMFCPYMPIKLISGKGADFYCAVRYGLLEDDIEKEVSKWHIAEEKNGGNSLWSVTLNKEDFLPGGKLPFRMAVTAYGDAESFWEKDDRVYTRLTLGKISPDSYVFVI